MFKRKNRWGLELGSGGWILPAAVMILGAFLRLWRLDQPQLWLDELIQLALFAEGSLAERIQLAVSKTYGAVPLDYLVQDLSVTLLGRGEWPARLPAALFGCLSLPLFFRLASRKLGRSQGLVATFFLAVYPLHIFYSREARNYSLFFLLTVLHFLVLEESIKTGSRRWWAVHSGVGILLFYTNAFATLVFLAEITYVASLGALGLGTALGRKPKSVLVPCCASIALAFLAFLPWLWWAWDWTLSRASASESFGSIVFWWRLFKEVSGGSRPLSLLIFVLAIAGCRSLLKGARPATLAFSLSWLMVPLIGVLFIDWWRSYFFAIRQIFFATAPLLLLAAVGFAEITRAVRHRAVPVMLLALFAALGLGTIALSDRKEEADWKGLVSYLEANMDPQDRVCAPLIEWPLRYLSPSAMTHIAGLEELERKRESELAATYLVESRYQPPEVREQLQRLADRDSPIQAFQGFTVYRARNPD